MVANIVGDSITMIMERMSYLHASSKKITRVTDIIKQHLFAIKGVFEHNDATPRPGWLIDVADAVTDLEDLLDDQDVPADAALLPKQTKITSFSSLYNLTITHRSLLLQLEQIEKRLQHIAGDSTNLLLKNSKRLTSSNSKNKEIKVVGRKAIKEEIIRKILDLTKVKGDVPVVMILGMQGIGKTTLAKFVCDDERMKENFDLEIWIDDIRHEFYAESIVERMIHVSASKKKKKKLESEEDPIAIDENLNLGEAIGGSRFLLVLDDLQSKNRGEWLRLQQILRTTTCLFSGAVLVTTNNSLVANVVEPRYAWPLGGLSEEDSCTLFEQITGGGGGGGPSESKIRDAQKKMVSKCRGVPVAILTMATMLRSRGAIIESEIGHLEEEFMQEMKLIYYEELPSWHLKQCFAYLSFIFYATKQIKAETLTRLWMAEGFLGPMNSNSSFSPQQPQPEDLGLDCIQEFGSRSILDVEEDQYGTLTYCSISNQLILQLSKFVAGKDRFCMDDQDDNVKETARRVSLTPSLDVSHGIPKSVIIINKNLRTILFPMPFRYRRSSRIPYELKLSWSACDMIFCACKSLRVLNLADLGMKMLPASIGELKSLRYLDLSHNNMKKLPNSIGKLKHLQTLILSHCYQLRELPNEVKHLVSLRHLEMKECLHMAHMPSALKKLTNLQTLSHFMASRTSNNHNHKHITGFGELINLNSLRGTMEVSHLERLKFKELEQDGHAYLKGKQHLKQLTLEWNHNDEGSDDDNNHDQISLGHLEPHPNLQELRIVGYKGTNFSDRLSSLKNLVGLILYNCSKCQSLPSLDQFPKLKFLELKRLDSLEYITDQDDGCNELGLGLLEDLSISDCPNLTSWWKGRTHNNAILFGSISRLKVKYCPKLDCMPLYPNLDHKLVLEGSSVKPLLETINYTSASISRMSSDLDSTSNSYLPLSKLEVLIITKLEEQSPLPEDWLKNLISLHFLCISDKKSPMKGFKHLSSLTEMYISNCTRIELPEDEWEGLQSLKRLSIEEVIELKSLPEGIKHLTSLEYLTIWSCLELTTLTEGIGHLKSLESLLIYDCHKLASLPKEMSNLTSLKWLRIRDCPLLLPRCQTETGDDWPQIKHIKDIYLEGTPEIYE